MSARGTSVTVVDVICARAYIEPGSAPITSNDATVPTRELLIAPSVLLIIISNVNEGEQR